MLAYLQWMLLEFSFDKAADAVYRFRVQREARREMYRMNLEFPNPEFGICPIDGGCVHTDHTHSHQLARAGR